MTLPDLTGIDLTGIGLAGIDVAGILLGDARRAHQRGALPRAIALYRANLDARPDDAAALRDLARAYLQSGEATLAVGVLARAVEIDADDAGGWNLYGAGLANLGQGVPAERAYLRALALSPAHAEAHTNLGNLLAAQGKHEAALDHYGQALAASPDLAETHNNLGAALAALDRHDEALVSYRKALTARPGYSDALANWGHALLALGNPQQAAVKLASAVAAEPTSVPYRIEAAAALRHAGLYGESLDAAEQALALDAASARAHDACGAALRPLGRTREAIARFRQALEIDPTLVEAHTNLAVSLAERGEIDAALRSSAEALARAPRKAAIQLNQAMIRLLSGDLAGGFAGYDARWRTPEGRRRVRPFSQPRWRGQRLAGASILVWGEQGIGETIMFGALLPRLIAGARRVAVECDRRLVPLFARSFPGARVLPREDPPHVEISETAGADLDFQTPAGDLCRWLRPDSAAPPHPFLRAERTRVDEIRARYRGFARGALVGISWQSRGPNFQFGAGKSTELEAWTPILRCTGATFVDLQYGPHDPAIAAARAHTEAVIHQDTRIDQGVNLDNFAAQIAALDLVITTSNTTAHMAGALGIPVWVLLPKGPDWRWQLQGERSLWYASARLLRQRTAGDWQGLLADVGRQLAAWLRQGPCGR